VIAMGEPAVTVTPAIEAVKAEMALHDPAESPGDDVGATSSRHRTQCPACRSFLTEPLQRSPDGLFYTYFRCTACEHGWAATG
jgi:hypothetical protein